MPFAGRLGRPAPRAKGSLGMNATSAVMDRLPFPLAEYGAKLALLQRKLSERRLAGALIFDPENIFCATGYRSIGYFTFQALYIPATGGPVLISRIFIRKDAPAT